MRTEPDRQWKTRHNNNIECVRRATGRTYSPDDSQGTCSGAKSRRPSAATEPEAVAEQTSVDELFGVDWSREPPRRPGGSAVTTRTTTLATESSLECSRTHAGHVFPQPHPRSRWSSSAGRRRTDPAGLRCRLVDTSPETELLFGLGLSSPY